MSSFGEGSEWEPRYARIIEWGKRLKPLDPVLKQDRLLVRGCQSRVWLLSEKKEGLLFFRGESEALITQGLLSMMIYFYSSSPPQEVINTSPFFVEKLDLLNHLTPARSGGLSSLIRTMKRDAQVLMAAS